VGEGRLARHAAGGYASTDLGKIVAAAFLDSYNKVVKHVQSTTRRSGARSIGVGQQAFAAWPRKT